MTAIGGQRVAIRADAAERSRYVVAAECALVTVLDALVDVLAHLHRSGRVPISALALEAAVHVGAGAVAANVGQRTLVVVCPSNRNTDLELVKLVGSLDGPS